MLEQHRPVRRGGNASDVSHRCRGGEVDRVALRVDPTAQHLGACRAPRLHLKDRPLPGAVEDPAPHRCRVGPRIEHRESHCRQLGNQPAALRAVGDGVAECHRPDRSGAHLHSEVLRLIGYDDRAEGRVEPDYRRALDRQHILVRVVVVEQHRESRQLPRSHSEFIGYRYRRLALGDDGRLLLVVDALAVARRGDSPVLRGDDEEAVRDRPDPPALTVIQDHAGLVRSQRRHRLPGQGSATVVERSRGSVAHPHESGVGVLVEPGAVHHAVERRRRCGDPQGAAPGERHRGRTVAQPE